MGPALVFGTLGHFASDDRRLEDAFGPIVGRFDSFRFKKPQDVATILLDTNAIEQALIVVIPQNTIAQMVRQFYVEFLVTSLEVFRGQIATCMPQGQPFPQKSV